MLSIVITVAGLLAIPNLPLSEYPDVVPPIVQVRAVYPGANPTTVARRSPRRSRKRSTASTT